ncbi:MAG: cytochrome c biogenesis protein ResB [Planctomycetes bacterium]|nr:cytochrome c biogenesis protein ResB [Planctomycetota bacterium]
MYRSLRQTWLWKALTSVRLTMVLLPLIIVACIAGSLFEQERANRLVYHSVWFNGLIALLGVNTLICMLSRATLRWSQATFILNHISLLVIMAGAVVGGLWGFRGMMVIPEGGSSRTVRVGNEKVELEFSVFLKDFQVIYGGSVVHRLSVTQPGRDPAVVEVQPVVGTRVPAGEATLVVQA